MTKNILCYGDSLTWGYNAVGPSRHAYEDRWPSVLQAELGDAIRVIPDGLNGRTTAFDDHLAGADRNGAKTLPTSLATHAPLDLVIIFLGANDMKPWINGNPVTAKYGILRLVEIVRGEAYGFGWSAPKILIVSPPVLSPTDNVEFQKLFVGGEAASRELARLYAEVADLMGCGFFDAGSVAKTTPVDGLHLDAENTRAVGRGLAPVVRKMLEL
jgi:lysophospholipase L1-like esterase